MYSLLLMSSLATGQQGHSSSYFVRNYIENFGVSKMCTIYMCNRISCLNCRAVNENIVANILQVGLKEHEFDYRCYSNKSGI